MKKINQNTKLGIAITFLVIGILGVSGLTVTLSHNINDEIVTGPIILNDNEYVDNTSWHIVKKINSKDIMLNPLGEYTPGDGSSHWCSTFILDYGQVPGTVLANNATDWSTAVTARGYVDSDAQTIDLAAEDPGFFVVRAAFNTDAQESGSWNYSRFRINLTFSGDEVDGDSLNDVGIYQNVSGDIGDMVVSGDTADWLFCNFWWDDNDNGYAITMDGSIDWELTIYAKY